MKNKEYYSHVFRADRLRRNAEKALENNERGRAGELFIDAAIEYDAALQQEEDTLIRNLVDICADQALALKEQQSVTTIEGSSEESTQKARSWIVEKPNITFKDIAGLNEVKEYINKKLILPFKHPELVEKYGGRMGGGLILYGPPGTGKTHICRATAGEIDANMYSVSASDILGPYVGESEQNLANLFAMARQEKRAIIVFDEIDALGGGRGKDSQGYERRLLSKLLSEIDGMKSLDGVLLIGTTNDPEHVDKALRRPGRFTKQIYVDLPNSAAREQIFKFQLNKSMTEAVDFRKLASISEEYSGADIKGICEEVIDNKIVAGAQGDVTPITTRDIEEVIAHTKPSVTQEDLVEYVKFAKKH